MCNKSITNNPFACHHFVGLLWNNMKTILITTLIGLLLAVLIGLATQNFCLKWQQWEIWEQGYRAGYNTIKTIREFQQQIGCEKIDGKVSPDYQHSETQEKWVAAICQQYANVQINNRTMGIAAK